MMINMISFVEQFSLFFGSMYIHPKSRGMSGKNFQDKPAHWTSWLHLGWAWSTSPTGGFIAGPLPLPDTASAPFRCCAAATWSLEVGRQPTGRQLGGVPREREVWLHYYQWKNVRTYSYMMALSRERILNVRLKVRFRIDILTILFLWTYVCSVQVCYILSEEVCRDIFSDEHGIQNLDEFSYFPSE